MVVTLAKAVARKQEGMDEFWRQSQEHLLMDWKKKKIGQGKGRDQRQLPGLLAWAAGRTMMLFAKMMKIMG